MHTHNTTYKLAYNKFKPEAQLLKRDNARRYVSKTRYGSSNASNSKLNLKVIPRYYHLFPKFKEVTGPEHITFDGNQSLIH